MTDIDDREIERREVARFRKWFTELERDRSIVEKALEANVDPAACRERADVLTAELTKMRQARQNPGSANAFYANVIAMYMAAFDDWLEEWTEWMGSADERIIGAGGGLSAADQRLLVDVESSPEVLALRERLRDVVTASEQPTREVADDLVDEVHRLLLAPGQTVSPELQEELVGLLAAMDYPHLFGEDKP